jgi:hypothetical protein
MKNYQRGQLFQNLYSLMPPWVHLLFKICIGGVLLYLFYRQIKPTNKGLAQYFPRSSVSRAILGFCFAVMFHDLFTSSDS